MKHGLTLQELDKELTIQAKRIQDFLVPTNKLRMEIGKNDEIEINVADQVQIPLTDHALSQIATEQGFPLAFLKRLRGDMPDKAIPIINEYWQRGIDGEIPNKMIRTFKKYGNKRGLMRGYVSSTYRRIDNADFGMAVLEALKMISEENKTEIEVHSCALTESKFLIKAVDEHAMRAFEPDAKWGEGHEIKDMIAPAVCLGNSDVGDGSVEVSASIWTKACTNLAVFSQNGFRRRHIGKRAEADDNYNLLSDEAKEAADAAMWLEIRDVTKNVFAEKIFEANILRLQGAAEQEVVKAQDCIELAAKRWSWNEDEAGSVLGAFLKGGGRSRYDLHSAITRASQDVEDYTKATDMERQGAELLELNESEWKVLNTPITRKVPLTAEQKKQRRKERRERRNKYKMVAAAA